MHTDDYHSNGPVQFVKTLHDYPLAELREYIDWQPFFNAWEMKGKFPDILNNPASGEAARRLWDDAQQMLDRLIAEKWLTASGVLGLFPANAVGDDDIEVYTDETRTETSRDAARTAAADRAPTRRAAPVAGRLRRPQDRPALRDYVGAFAVTAGLGSAEKIVEFKAALDDYSAILLEVAGRPAGRGVRRAAARARPHRVLGLSARRGARSAKRLLKERYVGIRPAPGYPACPEHTEKATIWDLLDVKANTGIELTDSMAMWPGRVGQRPVLLAPAVAVLRARSHRPRPGRGIRPAQGLDRRRGRAVAVAQPRLPLRQRIAN